MEPRAPTAAEAAALRIGRQQPFDTDWKFFRGAGEAFSAPEFDDRGWRGLDLPHDWSIENLLPVAGSGIVGPFDPKSIGGSATGFTGGGEGWYRKHFTGDGLPAGARVEVLFDGAYDESEVWLNGRQLGRHLYGYTPFAYDLTGHIRPGDNVLAVRVRNIGKNQPMVFGLRPLSRRHARRVRRTRAGRALGRGRRDPPNHGRLGRDRDRDPSCRPDAGSEPGEPNPQRCWRRRGRDRLRGD